MNFLITCNEDGTIATCEAVEGKKRGMFYVHANSKEEACAIFAERYRRNMQRGKKSHAKIRAEREALGLCAASASCPNKAAVGKRSCQPCIARAAANYEKRKASGACTGCKNKAIPGKINCEECAARERENARRRNRGLPAIPKIKKVLTPQEEAALYLKTRRQEMELRHLRGEDQSPTQYISTRVYRKVLTQYRSLSPERFEGWLVSELNKAQDAKRERAARARAQLIEDKANGPVVISVLARAAE